MAGVVLDAGALIAADKDDRRFWVWWKYVTAKKVRPTVPSPVVAQVWRSSKSVFLARMLSKCEEVALDAGYSKRIGLLCARSGASDVVDAFVVLLAADRKSDILTSDPLDIGALKTHAPNTGRVWTVSDLSRKSRDRGD